MAVLFVSHSSQDDAIATSLEAWLRLSGFIDIFVDHHSIAAGDAWRAALQKAAGTCRAVLCLVTSNWLASKDCLAEFDASFYMGKRVIPLLLLPAREDLGPEAKSRLAQVCQHYQGVDILSCLRSDGTLDLAADRSVADRLKAGLREAGALARIGFDPEAFAVDRDLRPTPFPGLSSFGDDDADAALFYGRPREIAEAQEALRQMRATGQRRPFMILGGSGTGKSSLLLAGIIPRLRREAAAWLPLRAFRPGADPLLNFAEAFARTLADFGKAEAHGIIRDRLFEAWSKIERKDLDPTPAGFAALEAALKAEGHRLLDAAGRGAATILIAIDQAEELARAEGDSGDALSDYLRVALVAEMSWQLAFTIRTDSFAELQSHRRFVKLEARGYDLRAIPGYRFGNIIEGPAKRYGITVDTALVDALVDDAPRDDALPLLAFALQRLWGQYAVSGALTKENYEKIGGLKALIEDAAERALRGLAPGEDVPLPTSPPAKWLLDLGASTFVPALAQFNDQGAVIRCLAAWNSFSDQQRQLLEGFAQWRLIIRKGDLNGGTVEVAHEALFREWTRLKRWLEPEQARLQMLRSLQLDAATWDRSGRDATFLNHRDKRLAETVALADVESYSKRLGALERDYLAACQEANRLARRRTRRTQAVVGSLALAVVAAAVGWLNEAYLLERINWFVTMRPYMMANFQPYVLTAEAERALERKASFRECARHCPEMIVVPAGTFMMGTSETAPGHYPDEAPEHLVTISRPFAVSKFDVTFDEWDACVAVGACHRVNDSGFGRGSKPVINVTWDDAQQYVAWLSKMTGRPYRLLTEAEWEYAARAGTTTAYYWGDEIGTGNANCIGCAGPWDNRGTSPVGSFMPNGFGLYDMSGNVWQWVQDCVHEDYNGAPTDGSIWTAGDCNRHVIRGGAWNYDPRIIRVATRARNTTVGRVDYTGVRVGRTILSP